MSTEQWNGTSKNRPMKSGCYFRKLLFLEAPATPTIDKKILSQRKLKFEIFVIFVILFSRKI